MNVSRLLLCIIAASLLIASGCNRRGEVEVEELRAENQRLTAELEKLYAQASELERQRNAARDELAKYREQAKGLSEQLRSALAGARITGLEITEEGSIAMGHDFAFGKGSADLTDAGRSSIGKLAGLLQSGEYAGTNVVVVGHTDNTPVVRDQTKKLFGDNWGLSAMRAAAVVRALQEAGIPPRRLHGAFRGEYQPRASNDSGKGKGQNRRVEIFLSL